MLYNTTTEHPRDRGLRAYVSVASLSDITGVTGMKIIRAIVSGERDPDVLASLRDVSCHSSVETIKASLIGNDRDEHVFAAFPITRALRLLPGPVGPKLRFWPTRRTLWEHGVED